MKIVNRKTFLELPNNILFCEFDPNIFGDFCIKTRTLENDFCYISLMDFNDDGSSKYGCYDIFDASLEKGVIVPLDLDIENRDGCFDDNQLFAVFDANDINSLINKLKTL